MHSWRARWIVSKLLTLWFVIIYLTVMLKSWSRIILDSCSRFVWIGVSSSILDSKTKYMQGRRYSRYSPFFISLLVLNLLVMKGCGLLSDSRILDEILVFIVVPDFYTDSERKQFSRLDIVRVLTKIHPYLDSLNIYIHSNKYYLLYICF